MNEHNADLPRQNARWRLRASTNQPSRRGNFSIWAKKAEIDFVDELSRTHPGCCCCQLSQDCPRAVVFSLPSSSAIEVPPQFSNRQRTRERNITKHSRVTTFLHTGVFGGGPRRLFRWSISSKNSHAGQSSAAVIDRQRHDALMATLQPSLLQGVIGPRRASLKACRCVPTRQCCETRCVDDYKTYTK